MKTSIALATLASLLLCPHPLLAAEESCVTCAMQVSLSGEFAHRKDDASVTIDGATNDPAAFREEINGMNFTVTIAHLPAGKYTVVIGAAETLASGSDERVFDVTSGDVSLARNLDL